MWSQEFTFNDAGFEKLCDPQARKILADEGSRSMKNDIEAVEQIEGIYNCKKINVEFFILM